MQLLKQNLHSTSLKCKYLITYEFTSLESKIKPPRIFNKDLHCLKIIGMYSAPKERNG